MELYNEAGDLIDPDEMVRYNWDVYGAPQKVLRKPAQVEQIRASRAQAQQQMLEQQQQAQEVENISKLAPVSQGGQ